MIRNRFALDDNNQIIDIQNLTIYDRKNYICLGCKDILRPVLGAAREKHFRHKVGAECNGETYLHILGKRLFEHTYRSCLKNCQPFEICFKQYKVCTFCHLQGPCTIGNFNLIKYDLVLLFKEISIEELDSQFIPDITLKNPAGEVVYIEIAVSHKCSDVKLQSGKRIIEIALKDEKDADLILLKLLSSEDKGITFHNFKNSIRGNFSSECTKNADIVMVDNAGKRSSRRVKWYEYVQMLKNKDIHVTRL